MALTKLNAGANAIHPTLDLVLSSCASTPSWTVPHSSYANTPSLASPRSSCANASVKSSIAPFTLHDPSQDRRAQRWTWSGIGSSRIVRRLLYKVCWHRSIPQADGCHTVTSIGGTAVVLGVTEDDIQKSCKRSDEHLWFNTTVELDEANERIYSASPN